MTREMTHAQFKARLKANGIRQFLMWFEHINRPNVSVGGIFNAKTGKLMRRETLAKLVNPKSWEVR